jgi:radical SAM superfamily enzyme YgiQ (UPF0313 family)
MKITFIRPHLTDARSADAMEPLVFALFAGLTPPGVELDFLDERLETIPDDHNTDLVALTVETFTARRAYQIATRFRQRGIPVVMGGYHPSFLPREALIYADAVVIGEAEEIWGRLVRDAQRGKLQRIYRQRKQSSLSDLRFERSIFEGKRYKPIALVQHGRGCPFVCDFCSIHTFYGSRTRQRPVAQVVAEIKALDRKYVLFVDDNLFVNVSQAEELFQALIPLNIHWAGQISINVAQNVRLMDLMAKSGCFCALIGFESLNKANLIQIKKKWNLKDGSYDAAVRKSHDRGIMIYASFVFGCDDDTVDSFDITAEYAIRSKFALVNFAALNPMPGSGFYNRLMNENRLIFERWWLDPDYRYGQATFRPLLMTADELTEGCVRARRMFFGYGSILKRALDPAANCRTLHHLKAFLIGNLITRRELDYKLAHRLGADTPLEPGLENVPLKRIPGIGLELGPATGS